MNRHEDDESTGHSSQSSRHSSRLFKYDDITILIEALTGQLYELKCSPTENILSIKGESTLENYFQNLIFQVVWQDWRAFQPISNILFIRGNYWMILQS